MVKILVIFVCCAALSAWAENCPDPMAEQLNLTAYAGTWYPLMELDWTTMNCSFVKYSEVNKTTLSVRNSTLGASNEYDTVEGEAVLREDKHFSVRMGDNYTDDYYVVSTDYGNYSVVMACSSSQNTTRALVLAREKMPSNETRDLLDDEVSKLKLGKMAPVWQGDCPNAAPAYAPGATLLGLLLAALVARRSL